MGLCLKKKNIKDVLCTPITQLANFSMRQSIFPNAWKSAVVKTIFKAGETMDVANYRPISVLPITSQIIEKW